METMLVDRPNIHSIRSRMKIIYIIELLMLSVLTAAYLLYTYVGYRLNMDRDHDSRQYVLMIVLSLGVIGFAALWFAFIRMLLKRVIERKLLQILMYVGLLAGVIADGHLMIHTFTKPVVGGFRALSSSDQMLLILLTFFPVVILAQVVWWMTRKVRPQ
jgi:hypothetical protein